MTVSSLIPYHNEGNRPLEVLAKISQITNIDEIICIDDGSIDNTSELINQSFPRVKIIRCKQNRGKSAAIGVGLKQAKGDLLLLADADLKRVNPSQFSQAIDQIRNNSDIDMIIFKRLNDPWIGKRLNGDVFTSGERILKKSDLQKIFSAPPNGYDLEMAINRYMLRNKKRCFWTPSDAINTSRLEKEGTLKGQVNLLKMFLGQIFRFGPVEWFYQIFLFCKSPI